MRLGTDAGRRLQRGRYLGTPIARQRTKGAEMHEPSHQTVRLSAGKHPSPQSGVCVMELASMLAGEPFTDHPRSVCPVIATVLRAYNDALDDGRRQDLYRYASAAVGTRGDRELRERRFEL